MGSLNSRFFKFRKNRENRENETCKSSPFWIQIFVLKKIIILFSYLNSNIWSISKEKINFTDEKNFQQLLLTNFTWGHQAALPTKASEKKKIDEEHIEELVKLLKICWERKLMIRLKKIFSSKDTIKKNLIENDFEEYPFFKLYD